jgi:hypothetical protein
MSASFIADAQANGTRKISTQSKKQNMTERREEGTFRGSFQIYF